MEYRDFHFCPKGIVCKWEIHMITYTLNKADKNSLRDTIKSVSSSMDLKHLGSKVSAGFYVASKAIQKLNLSEYISLAKNDALFVQGLPDDLSEDETSVMSGTLGCLLGGLPWNWQSQGTLFMAVKPRKEAHENTNATAEDFGPHSDDAVFKFFSPEYIILLCQENTAKTETGWVNGKKLTEHWPPAFLHTAINPYFMMRAPLSIFNEPIWLGPMPIIKETIDGGIECPFASYAVESFESNGLHNAVIELARESAHEKMEWVTLSAGNALILPQRKGLHARKKIIGSRNIERTYWNTDLSHHRKYAAISDDPWRFDARKALLSIWPDSPNLNNELTCISRTCFEPESPPYCGP